MKVRETIERAGNDLSAQVFEESYDSMASAVDAWRRWCAGALEAWGEDVEKVEMTETSGKYCMYITDGANNTTIEIIH